MRYTKEPNAVIVQREQQQLNIIGIYISSHFLNTSFIVELQTFFRSQGFDTMRPTEPAGKLLAARRGQERNKLRKTSPKSKTGFPFFVCTRNDGKTAENVSKGFFLFFLEKSLLRTLVVIYPTRPPSRESGNISSFLLPKYTQETSFFLSYFFFWSRVLNCVQTLGELLFFPFSLFWGVLLSPQNKCPAPPKHFI